MKTQTNEHQHTPGPFMMTPWKIDTGIKSESYAIRNTSGLTVAVCGYKEHAAFIVRAVNSHDELMKFIRSLDFGNECGCPFTKSVMHDDDCHQIALEKRRDQVISEAEGDDD